MMAIGVNVPAKTMACGLRFYDAVKPSLLFKTALMTVLLQSLFCMQRLPCLDAAQEFPCLKPIHPNAAIVMTAPDGQVLFQQNASKKYIPASTLKILTALAAIHHLGLGYRFHTEFYTHEDQDLIIKGYGDPLLTSEILLEISGAVADRLIAFRHLILDNTYFSEIQIPGVGDSQNPYDAPLGALCANFNTIFFDRDSRGRIISAEPQTPLTPFARDKIRALGRKNGRYTFAHDPRDAARYAGEMFLYFMKKKGIAHLGEIRLGRVKPEDRCIYTYQSGHTLEVVIKKMLEFSNNFVANQLCIALGVHVYGPPGTLKKGVSVLSDYAKEKLHLAGLEIAEGSGISRQNRISAQDMLTVLKGFRPYRHLLKRSGNILVKTGTLNGINTRVGYINSDDGTPCPFVIFFNNGERDIEGLMDCIANRMTR